MGKAIIFCMSDKYIFMLQVFLISLLILLNSCMRTIQHERIPNEFLNHVLIKKENYLKDSIEIITQLKKNINSHENFFYSTEYFDSTKLLVDSIIYSPDFNKLAIFIITKNPSYRQRMPDKNYDWYYDANCYLGIRQNDSIKLSSIGPSFLNYKNKDELSRIIRNTYFTKYATIKDTNGFYRNKYNIGDIRFWNCPIWKEIEEEKLKKKRFEEEKNMHPENVYEPIRLDSPNKN